MTVWKLMVVGVACFAMCGDSIGLVSKPEGNVYEEYLKNLRDTVNKLKEHIKEWDITVTAPTHQLFTYKRSKKGWDEVVKQLFASIDKTITDMGSKKTFGIKLGFGGMAAKDQQLVKDVKIFAEASSNDMYRMLKAGVNPKGKTIDSVGWQLKEIQLRINKFDPEKESNDKTREVKEALASVLQSLQVVYEAMSNKLASAKPAKK